MMIRRWCGVITSMLMTLMLIACGPIATPPLHVYTIADLQPVTAAGRAKTKHTLLVANPIAAAGYQTSAMIYMRTPFELQAYANNRWVAPPAQMLLPLFVQALRHYHYFHAVVAPPFAGITTWRLDTRLLKLQQEFLLPTSRIRLVVQATLISNTTNRVVTSHQFAVVIPAGENNPYGGVLAANKAANIMSQRIAQFTVHYAR